MAVTSGTANDHADLLGLLRAFLQANGWTSLRWTGAEFIAMGVGLGGTDQIYVGIDLHENPVADWFNWRLNGMTGFNDSLAFEQQPGNIAYSAGTVLPRLHLWNTSIAYWFIVNARRVIVIAKVSTVYQAAYLGLIKPYLPGSALPYPLMIAGTSTDESGRWSSQLDRHSFGITQPVCSNYSSTEATILTNPTSSCRFWSGEWHGIQNHFNNSFGNQTSWKGLWPFNQQYNADFSQMRNNPQDGAYTLIPVTVCFRSPFRQLFGELDGVYWVTGFGNAAENVITIQGVDYLVVQNIFRNSFGDFCAIRLE